MGSWGQASYNGYPITLRALDWEAHAPISGWPTISVYHPTEPGSVPFANIGWAGYLGSITGYNSEKISFAERLKGAP